MKVEPLPGSLCTAISPPMSFTRWLDMDSPSPVPPKLRVVEASACVKGVNSRAKVSLSMPMPLSATRNSTVTCSGLRSASTARTDTRPNRCCPPENLMALPARLISTWRSRIGSPMTSSGIAGSMNRVSSTPFFSAMRFNMPQTFSTVLVTCMGVLSISIRPASALEKSRMSSMMDSRENADSRMRSTISTW